MKLWYDRILCVLGALLFLQIPQFMYQYQQQLIGHVAELSWQVESMQQTAAGSGKTLEQYIQKFEKHEDSDFSKQGKVMDTVASRWKRFTTALKALEESSIITRPWIFLYHIDFSILGSTLHSFKIGLSLTLESVIYALIGIIFGHLVFVMLDSSFGKKKKGETPKGKTP